MRDRPWLTKLVAGILVGSWAAGTVLVGRRMYTRLEIEGVSMLPELAPGDRVVIRKTRQVAVGDTIALRDPDDEERHLVKRVVGLEYGAVRVEGDNEGASRDSRHFGPVPSSLVLGRVVTRYGRRRTCRGGRGSSRLPRAH
jgi:nickel-type superoxide dismutase maturation protease